MNANIMKAQIKFLVDHDKSVQGKDFYRYLVKCPETLKCFDWNILVLSMNGYKKIEK